MPRFTRGLVVTLVVLVLGSFVVMLQQKPASGAPGSAPVTVVNTPLPTTVTNTPLPATVSGNVNVNNFPPNQTVSGTVSVNNFPPPNQNVSATVVNTSLNPVPILDVNTSAEEPFQTFLCFNSGSFSGVPCPVPVSIVVPSMTTDNLQVKRLVIENVSGYCQLGPTTQVQAMAVSVRPLNENTVNNVSQAIALFTPAAPTFTAFNGTTRLYADPGANLGLLGFIGGNDYFCTVFVNGYFITK